MTWSSSMSSGYSSLEEEESEEFFFTARTSFFRRPPGKTRAAPQVSAGLRRAASSLHVAAAAPGGGGRRRPFPCPPCWRLGAALPFVSVAVSGGWQPLLLAGKGPRRVGVSRFKRPGSADGLRGVFEVKK